MNNPCTTFFQQIMPKYGFNLRQPQLSLSMKILEAIADNKLIIAEAEVGTGKTFAYLFPAILSNIVYHNKILISTKTISLQEQLINKDIPQIANIIEETMHKPRGSITYALRKGKNNYICENQLTEYQKKDTSQILGKIIYEYDNYGTIDRNDFTFAINDTYWERICASNCNARRCKNRYCGYKEYINTDLSIYDILVCNHSYFLSCLKGNNPIINNYPIAIFDEAHSIEDTCYEIYGNSFILKDCKAIVKNNKLSKIISTIHINSLVNLIQEIYELFYSRTEFPRIELSNEFQIDIADNQIQNTAEQICWLLGLILDKYSTQLSMKNEDGRADDTLSRSLENLLEFFNQILHSEEYIWWTSRIHDNEVILHNTPKNIPNILSEKLFNSNKTIILTSGTMSAHLEKDGNNHISDFNYFEEAIGISNLKASRLMSPIQIKSDFNYSHNGLLYFESSISFVPIDDVVRHLQYLEKLCTQIINIIKSADGRTLLLFTSKHEMQYTYDKIQPILNKYGYDCYIQSGNSGTHKAKEKFTYNIHSCLFSASYWEGIDVKGPSLSTVIIHKLPYPCPSPSYDYRNTVMSNNGYRNLKDMQMLTKLRQGVGRLIRDKDDKGVVAILDSRANRYTLKNTIITNLPPFRIIDNINEIQTFFKSNEIDAQKR